MLLYHGGAVCSYPFDTNEAVAICRELGYNTSGAVYQGLDDFWDIEDSLEFTLLDVECTDSMNWSDCDYTYGSGRCYYGHVHLTCDGKQKFRFTEL